MAAPNGFPSWAYNSAGQSALIVQTLFAFNALPGPGTWSATPFSTTTPVPPAPFDTVTSPGTSSLQVTDIRLQQILIEQRVSNYMMAQSFLLNDDPQTIIRPDVLSNDSSLTS
jgi:hypothetical protein